VEVEKNILQQFVIVLFNKWRFGATAIRFLVGTMSAAGTPTRRCKENCLTLPKRARRAKI
jgi:hypothetical protein